MSNLKSSTFTIEDMPDEILEFIIGFLPPYKDFNDCKLVSKRWRRCVQNVIHLKKRNIERAIANFDLSWKTITPIAMAPTISKRYSHAAVVYDNSMYVFGGCTCSMTTFNDLWRLDLSKRQWVRPLTIGTYPSPKACSTMVCYKDSLVVFGGWTYPPAYPLHQTWYLFNELNVYHIPTNQWTSMHTPVDETPPPTAGHSVSVVKNWMIMFGGLHKPYDVVHSTRTNDIWKLNMDTWQWFKQKAIGQEKPIERYGQFQAVLNDENILMMGGSGGPSIYYTDAWILNMIGDVWKWIKLNVRNLCDAPPSMWCNPGCKVGDKIVVLSKSKLATTPPLMFISKGVWIPPVQRNNITNEGEINEMNQKRIDAAERQVDVDENVNGRRGTLKGVKRNNECPEKPPSKPFNLNVDPLHDGPRLAAFSTNHSIPPVFAIAELRRQKRNENIRRAEERLKKLSQQQSPRATSDKNNNGGASTSKKPLPKKPNAPITNASWVPKLHRNVLSMYVLDISNALNDTEPHVSWLPIKDGGVKSEGPEETVLYSLVEGNSELIMFGGIHKEATSLACTTNISNQVSNSLHFISAPRYVI